jgi:DNA-binding NtrC family response regulator
MLKTLGAAKTQLGIDGTIKAIETRAILEALERNRNNRLAAARELGMHKSTFFRKIHSLGIELPREDGRSR